MKGKIKMKRENKIKSTVNDLDKTVDLVFSLFYFSFLFLFCFIFYFLFLEQLGLGLISHAVTSVTI